MDPKTDLIEVHGGCHCQAIRFTAKCPPRISVYQCNCSICKMKQNHHFVVPQALFTLEKGEDSLSLYQFGTKTARHLFCKICGVTSFYQPRSNPEGYGITFHCIDGGEKAFPGGVEWKTFDGEHWEEQIKSSDIRQWSS